MADDGPETIEKTIAASAVAKLKLLFPAFLMGPIALIVAGLAIGAAGEPPEEPPPPIILYAALGMTFMTASLAFVILPKVLFEPRLPDIFGASSPLGPYLAALFTLRLVQAAALEGAALLGAVAIFLGANQGLLQVQPIHWAGAVPVLFFIGFIALYTPTDRGVAEEYERLKQRHAS